MNKDITNDEKIPYVIIYINGKKEIWPYLEAQEFCLYDLSNSIMYLSKEEYANKCKELEWTDE